MSVSVVEASKDGPLVEEAVAVMRRSKEQTLAAFGGHGPAVPPPHVDR